MLRHPGLLVVEDARPDGRLVAGADPSIGFYAGAALHDARGRAAGTLLVTADAPRRLDAAQAATLIDLAAGIEAVIGLGEWVAALGRALDHDHLTGLLSRRRFDHLLREAVGAAAAGTGNGCVVLCLDIDGFKAINDTHGHAAGDAVLTEAARRLLANVGRADHVARLSGDELAILMTAPASSRRVDRLSDRVLDGFAAPFRIGNMAVPVRISLGAASAPADATDPVALLRCADRALYRAKRTGGHRCRRFVPDLATCCGMIAPVALASGRWLLPQPRLRPGELPLRIRAPATP